MKVIATVKEILPTGPQGKVTMLMEGDGGERWSVPVHSALLGEGRDYYRVGGRYAIDIVLRRELVEPTVKKPKATQE